MQGRLLIVRLPARDRFGAHIRNLEIKQRIHSPMAVHQQPAIEKLETNFRRIAKRRLIDLFPERNRFAAYGSGSRTVESGS
jgi:hypothetical protein